MKKKRNVSFEGKLHILAVVILIASSVLTWIGYGQDIEYHAQRIAAIAEEMKMGAGIYRIYTTNSGGYGYASPLFYGDIFLYPAAFLTALGVDISITFRLFLASIMVGAYVSMYVCAKSVWDKKTGVLAAYLYAFSPILLADIFIRFAVGEALAFVFLPMVLVGFYRIVIQPKNTKTDWIWLSLGMSGLIFSHIITTVLTVILLVLLCAVHVKKIWHNKSTILSIGKAALLTVGITAYFSLPLLEQMVTTPLFVTDRQTSNLAGNTAPVWGLFFGSEYVSLLNFLVEKIFHIEDMFVTTWLPGAFGYLFFWLLAVRFWKKRGIVKDKMADHMFIWAVFYLAVSMVPFIQPLLEPFIGFIKIAWRNLTFYILFASLCAAVWLVKLKVQNKCGAYRAGLLLASFGTLVSFFGLLMITVHNGMYPFETLSSHCIGAGEYLTASVPHYDYAKERGDVVVCKENENVSFSFERCEGYSELSFSNLDKAAVFEVPVYMYRGYAVENEKTNVFYEPQFSENGLVEFTIDDVSEGTVKIYYKGTAIQHGSVWISAFTVIGLTVVLVNERKKKERKK